MLLSESVLGDNDTTDGTPNDDGTMEQGVRRGVTLFVVLRLACPSVVAGGGLRPIGDPLLSLASRLAFSPCWKQTTQ